MALPKIIYSISKLLYYICLVFVGFVFLGTMLTFIEYQFALDISLIEISEDRTHSKIYFPLTEMYLGFRNRFTVVIMLLSFAFYAFYFLTLSRFFKVFTVTEVFTHESILILRKFTRLNLVPFYASLLYLVIELAEESPIDYIGVFVAAFVHLLVALFVYLYLVLIKKGKYIQEENDLTI